MFQLVHPISASMFSEHPVLEAVAEDLSPAFSPTSLRFYTSMWVAKAARGEMHLVVSMAGEMLVGIEEMKALAVVPATYVHHRRFLVE